MPSPAGTLSGVRPRFFQPSIRLASWRAGQRSLSMPAASITCFIRRMLVVGVENGEAGLQADQFGMPAQDLDADGVEGAEPRHAFDRAADQRSPMRSFISRAALLVKVTARICDGQALFVRQDVGDAGRQHARLAGAGAGQHQHRAVDRFDGRALFGVEPLQIQGRGRDAAIARAEIEDRGGAGAGVAGVASGRSKGGSSKSGGVFSSGEGLRL